MKIELKNVKVNLAFSQETTMFQADVYVDGVKTAHAHNDGHGGCTNYHAYDGKKSQLKKAEEYATSLPDHIYGSLKIKSTLELIIDELLDKHLKQKESAKAEKKIQKLTLNHIVWGVPNADSFHMISFKGKPLFEEVKKHPQGKLALQNMLNEVKKKLQKGEIIFNKNL